MNKLKMTKFTETNLFFCYPDTQCTTLTFGDLFRLVIPVGWMLVSIMSVLSYALVPEEPQWASASVVALSALSGIGLVLAIYGFHRHATSFAIEENYNCTGNEEMSFEGKKILMIVRRQMRKQSLRTHAVLSTIMALASIACAVFFGDFAIELDKCTTHESCGSDVAWSGVGLFVSTLWIGTVYLAYRDLRNAMERESTSTSTTSGATLATAPTTTKEPPLPLNSSKLELSFKTIDFEEPEGTPATTDDELFSSSEEEAETSEEDTEQSSEEEEHIV